jgi:alpha-L-arabinofuranosidase
MSNLSRGRFVQSTLTTGTFLSGASLVRGDDSKPARLIVDPARARTPLDRRVFGSFLEHIGQAIYKGIYDPASKLADANGLRKDVADEIRDMGVPIVRYPGGNFVSGYNWLDGVGPIKDRRAVLDRAWNSLETNQFGTNEFLAWCRHVGTQPFLAVNLGSGSPENAAALAEYCLVTRLVSDVPSTRDQRPRSARPKVSGRSLQP